MRTLSPALVLGALLMTLAWPGSLEAQRPEGRRGSGPDREQLEQRIRAQMGRMMRERLGLDEQQAVRLSEVVQEFDGQRRRLFTLEQATRRRVEALLLEGGDDRAEALSLIERMSELRLREAELFRAEQEALLEVLEPAQVLRLQELRQDLGRRIRSLRGGRGGDATPRRGAGGAGSGAFRDGPGGPSEDPGSWLPASPAPRVA